MRMSLKLIKRQFAIIQNDVLKKYDNFVFNDLGTLLFFIDKPVRYKCDMVRFFDEAL